MYVLEGNTEKSDNTRKKNILPIIGAVVVLIIAAGIFFASRFIDAEETSYENIGHTEIDTNDILQTIAEEVTSEDYDYISPIDLEETPQDRLRRTTRIERERREFARSITREQIIEDFDYMMAILDENFPFFDLTYRRHGVDIREEARRFRYILVDETLPIDAMIFEGLLFMEFVGAIHWVGHLRPLMSRSEYIRYMSATINYPDTAWGRIFYERFTAHPSSAQFYGTFDESDFAEAQEQHEREIHTPDDFNIEVIEDGHIAYIRVNRLFDVQDIHRAILSDFYDQIADFNHLIIDIRGNTGSWPHAFHELITVPHIRRPIQLDIVTFYKGGEYNLRFLDALFDPGFNGSAERPFHFYGESFAITDEGIIGRNGRPLLLGTQYLVWNDLVEFDYYIMGFYYNLYPSSPDDLQSDFNGQIWLLTDWASGSGSEHVVALYKQENLAIIVGEQGLGIFMCPTLLSNYFALPNTGIIIRYDVGYPVCLHTGRPLEEGTPPHFSNRPDMDALETALLLIAEGAYGD